MDWLNSIFVNFEYVQQHEGLIVNVYVLESFILGAMAKVKDD